MQTLRQFKDEVRDVVSQSNPDNQFLEAIDLLSALDEEIFRNYASRNRPFFFKDGASDWPLTTGGLETFIQDFADYPISVRMGNYSRGNKPFDLRETTIADFASSFESEQADAPEYAGFQTADDRIMQRVHYPIWLDTEFTRSPFHFWFGPAGTYTALHSDTCDKLVYQCDGRKTWYLIAPQHKKYLNIDPDFGRGYDTSPFDPRKSSAREEAQAQGIPVIAFEIGPGDLFFLPGGWYHAIVAHSASLSFEYKSDPIPRCIEDQHKRQNFLGRYGELLQRTRSNKS